MLSEALPPVVRRAGVLACFLLLLASFLMLGHDASLAQPPDSDDVVVLDPSKVYFGKQNGFSNPAIIKRMKVYNEIPAYKRIKDESLKPTDSDYHFLVAEASRIFRQHVKTVATAKKYDMVAETTAVSATGRVLPDITKDVIKKVKGQP